MGTIYEPTVNLLVNNKSAYHKFLNLQNQIRQSEIGSLAKWIWALILFGNKFNYSKSETI